MKDTEEGDDDDIVKSTLCDIMPVKDLDLCDAKENANEKKAVNRTISTITRNLSNLSIVSPSSSACTLDECLLEKTKFMLQCSKCQRLTHYACTQLPPYQISLFMQKGYRLYVCSTCVGAVDKDILENRLLESEINEDDILQKETEMISGDIDKRNPTQCTSTCTQTSDTFKTNGQLIEINRNAQNELTRRISQLRKANDEKIKQNNENLSLKQRIATLEDDLETLRKHIKTKDDLSENTSTNTLKLRNVADKSTQAEDAINKVISNDIALPHTDDSNFIDRKLEQFSSNILSTVTKIVDEKLSLIGEQFQSLVNIPDKINENCKTFKDALTENIPLANTEIDFKVIMNENRNEQLVQERERKIRSTNIILHGVSEDVDKNEGNPDEEFVTAFLDTIGISNKPDSIIRLGKPDLQKNRPIKIRMKNESEKENVMSRLPNLKNAEERFKRISVTEDYTMEERNEIRKWVEKAKEKNQDESSKIIWKARGTPKNGMRLAKFTKR